MLPEIHGLFEAHLVVENLERSIQFYRDRLGLRLAHVFPDRQVAFFWTSADKSSMLGLWAAGNAPHRLSLHIAFKISVADVLQSPELLLAAGITPLDFRGQPTDQAVVLAWMPAVSLYFRDPDGHLLEYIAMLSQEPQPELGVIPWSEWNAYGNKAR